MARIRALLRPEQATGASYEQAPPRIPPPPHAWQGSPAPQPGNPARLAFPPGSGVRFTIGRTRDCDLCLTDLSVSRMHALLVRREDGWVLSDLGSHNGTRLNGWLVREAVRVRAGDRVEFGSMAFIIQDDQPAAPPPAGQPEEEEGPGPADAGP
jgi:predicted component of type VI protein secretion system